MLFAERVLLYSLAIALAALLVRELSKPAAPAAVPVVIPAPQTGEQPPTTTPTIADDPPSAAPMTPGVLVDASGATRLAMTLDREGNPRLTLNDSFGRAAIELSVSANETPTLTLSRGSQQLRMAINQFGNVNCRMASGEARQSWTVEPSGAAEWRLGGKVADPEAVIRLDSDGEISWEFVQVGREAKVSATLDRHGQSAIQLIGEKKNFAQMSLATSGEAEMGVGGGPRGIEALIRTDQAGSAEVAVTAPDHSGGPRLSMLPSGEMGVRIIGADGQSGPVMQMFKDTSAEITIVDSKSQRGPVMFRDKDGASLVGIRGDQGKHGPRMFQGADLKSLIELPGTGKSQAGWYSDAETAAFLGITGADGKPIFVAPQGAKMPAEIKQAAR